MPVSRARRKNGKTTKSNSNHPQRRPLVPLNKIHAQAAQILISSAGLDEVIANERVMGILQKNYPDTYKTLRELADNRQAFAEELNTLQQEWQEQGVDGSKFTPAGFDYVQRYDDWATRAQAHIMNPYGVALVDVQRIYHEDLEPQLQEAM